jgi:predicted TPR repeat methyltransferase
VSAPRELTIDEAITLGILLQKQGQFAEAQELYGQIFAADPGHPRAIHFAGVLAHQRGDVDDAITLVERSLVLAPDEADWHSNLGIIFQSAGRLDAAAAAYRRAIALDADHANAYNNLGVVLRALGRPLDAEAAYRTAIRLDPQHADAYTNLGILLNALQRTSEAAVCYCKAIALRPQHRGTRRLLALAHCTLGQIGDAVRILEEWLEEEPDDPIARHMLAACTQCDVPARATDAFVERTFDDFAASFEAKLARLSYRAPAIVARMLDEAALPREPSRDVLDAGCGTGLCGPHLARYARVLIGVDLSTRMLARAREKGVYDDLVRRELTEYLRECGRSFDLIVSADALVYFGDLRPVIAAVAAALRDTGMFVFTVEHLMDDSSAAGYRLEFHGRYGHTRSYVERLLAAAGFEYRIACADLRMEAGLPVAGLIIRATKAVNGCSQERASMAAASAIEALRRDP